jgi:hypothetical protein
LLHVPPKGFHRIRHYGLLATSARRISNVLSCSALCRRSATLRPMRPHPTTLQAPTSAAASLLRRAPAHHRNLPARRAMASSFVPPARVQGRYVMSTHARHGKDVRRRWSSATGISPVLPTHAPHRDVALSPGRLQHHQPRSVGSKLAPLLRTPRPRPTYNPVHGRNPHRASCIGCGCASLPAGSFLEGIRTLAPCLWRRPCGASETLNNCVGRRSALARSMMHRDRSEDTVGSPTASLPSSFERRPLDTVQGN